MPPFTEPNSKLSYTNQWEKHLNLPFDLSEWQDIAYELSKVSINITLNEANYKTLLPWYLVPILVAKMHLSTTRFQPCG